MIGGVDPPREFAVYWHGDSASIVDTEISDLGHGGLTFHENSRGSGASLVCFTASTAAYPRPLR